METEDVLALTALVEAWRSSFLPPSLIVPWNY